MRGRGIVSQARITWGYVLSERETLDTLGVFALTAILGVAAVSWADVPQPEPPLFTILGIAVSREVSLGTFGSAVLILWQVGRWGRRMVTRFTHLPEQIEALKQQIAATTSAVNAIDARCPLRRPEDDRGCE